ncbi:hypothetical protein ACCD09_31970, partial [Variovorax sp. Varisp62]
MTKLMEPLFELAIHLPGAGSRELLREVHRQLRGAILDGRLQPTARVNDTCFAMASRSAPW